MTGAGEERLFGRGVSTCATCDAAFFKDKTVYVIGGGDSAMEDTLTLLMYTNKVTIIHRKDSFKASKIMQDRVLLEKKIPVLWNTELVDVVGETKLEKIKVKDNKTGEIKELPADGLFVAVGHMPNSDLFKGQLELDQMGYIVTNMTTSKLTNNQEVWLHGAPTQTSVPGVFASGDVVDLRYKQAITAAGFGCMAALDAEKLLTGSISSW
jgi:thioredoxin reductase (NADPH)